MQSTLYCKDFSHIAFILLKIQPSKMHISPPLQYGANGHGADDIFQMHIRCKCFLPEVLSEKGTTFLTTHFCSKSSPPTLLRQMKMGGERCASLDNAEVFSYRGGRIIANQGELNICTLTVVVWSMSRIDLLCWAFIYVRQAYIHSTHLHASHKKRKTASSKMVH